MQVYVAKAPSTAASFDGQGTVWTKIYSSGLINPQTQEWATDIVNANNGMCQRPFEVRVTDGPLPLCCYDRPQASTAS